MEENDLWPRMWQKLYANGASSKQEEGTRRYWVTLSPEDQQRVFTTITQKLDKGKFVWYDPIRAIQENLRRNGKQAIDGPEFLKGDEGGDLVQVKYNGMYKICTRETAVTFGLEIIRTW